MGYMYIVRHIQDLCVCLNYNFKQSNIVYEIAVGSSHDSFLEKKDSMKEKII